MPVAMPTFFCVDQDPCSQHCWPAVVPGFQSMPVQLGLLTHAAWQSSRVFAVFTWPLKMFVFGSGVPHTGLQPTCIRTHVHTYMQFQKKKWRAVTDTCPACFQATTLSVWTAPSLPPTETTSSTWDTCYKTAGRTWTSPNVPSVTLSPQSGTTYLNQSSQIWPSALERSSRV